MPQARHYVRATEEAVYGTALASPTTAQRKVLQISESNANSVRATPVQWDIRSAGGSNRRVQRGSKQTKVAGSLKQILYPDQAAFWLKMAAGITGTPYELPSFTLDEVVVMEDPSRTANYNSFLGVKITDAEFTANNSANGVLWMMNLTLAGKQPRTITNTDFAEPALSAYPLDPYVMQDTTITLGGSPLTEWESISIKIKNIIPTDKFYESRYVSRLPWCGRDVSVDLKCSYKTQQHRTDFLASTAKSLSVVITNGTVVTTLAMNAANYYTAVADDIAMDSPYGVTLTLENDVDLSVGTDFTATVV